MFKLAGIPIRPFEYLSVPILIIAHVPCMHACMTHIVTSQGLHMMQTMSPSCHQHVHSIHAKLE